MVGATSQHLKSLRRMQDDGGWIHTLMAEAKNERMHLMAKIEGGRIENVAAPQIAVDYWKLEPDARLKDVVIAVRADEAGHRDVNHRFANELSQE